MKIIHSLIKMRFIIKSSNNSNKISSTSRNIMHLHHHLWCLYLLNNFNKCIKTCLQTWSWILEWIQLPRQQCMECNHLHQVTSFHILISPTLPNSTISKLQDQCTHNLFNTNNLTLCHFLILNHTNNKQYNHKCISKFQLKSILNRIRMN